MRLLIYVKKIQTLSQLFKKLGMRTATSTVKHFVQVVQYPEIVGYIVRNAGTLIPHVLTRVLTKWKNGGLQKDVLLIHKFMDCAMRCNPEYVLNMKFW